MTTFMATDLHKLYLLHFQSVKNSANDSELCVDFNTNPSNSIL